MPGYRYDEFWRDVGEEYASADPLGAVCWDGAPRWFNDFFARCQVRAVERAMRFAFPAGTAAGPALDIGCGTGRWTRWLDRWGVRATGLDLSPAMLAAADGSHGYALGDVTALPVADGACSLALSVTVLLHLPPEAQARAVGEIARVLHAGGTLVLLEMIRAPAARAHVFPRSIDGWGALLEEAGLRVLHAEGEAYAPLLRLAFLAGRPLATHRGTELDARKRRPASSGPSASDIDRLPAPARLAARAAVAASGVLEPAVARILPDRFALNACIVARKG